MPDDERSSNTQVRDTEAGKEGQQIKGSVTELVTAVSLRTSPEKPPEGTAAPNSPSREWKVSQFIC